MKTDKYDTDSVSNSQHAEPASHNSHRRIETAFCGRFRPSVTGLSPPVAPPSSGSPMIGNGAELCQSTRPASESFHRWRRPSLRSTSHPPNGAGALPVFSGDRLVHGGPRSDPCFPRFTCSSPPDSNPRVRVKAGSRSLPTGRGGDDDRPRRIILHATGIQYGRESIEHRPGSHVGAPA